MPYQTGSVVGVHDYLGKIRNFLLGWKAYNTPSFSGTGNGTIEAFGATDVTTNQTWTITCTDATTPGAELWSVVGSSSGNIGTATSYVLFNVSGITFVIIPRSVNFAVNDVFTVVVTGTGALTTSGDAGTLNEMYFDPVNINDSYLYASIKMYGVGTDDINITIYSVREKLSGDYRISWQLGPVYDGDLPINQQTNQSFETYQYCRDVPMTYWFNADSYAIFSSIKSDTNYHNCYCGFIIPYCSPTAYPFPGFVGATEAGTPATGQLKFSTTVNDEFHTFPFNTGKVSTGAFDSAFIYLPDGVWLPIRSGHDDTNPTGLGFRNQSNTIYPSPVYPAAFNDYALIFPWSMFTTSDEKGFNLLEPPANNEYALWPIEIAVGFQYRMGQILGKFRFCMAVFGVNIGVEDDITANSSNWLVLQDIYRNGTWNHFVLRQD